jgi:hypothetical protein
MPRIYKFQQKKSYRYSRIYISDSNLHHVKDIKYSKKLRNLFLGENFFDIRPTRLKKIENN